MLKHRLSFRVRWSEADPAGIAYYPRFFEWFDVATDALFASVGERWERMFPDNEIVGVPIIDASASFRSPVRYGDEVTIESEVVDLTDKTFRVEHRLSVGSILCAIGTEHRAWVGQPDRPTDRLRAKPIPEPIKRKLRGDAA